jgi:hypothetical protein
VAKAAGTTVLDEQIAAAQVLLNTPDTPPTDLERIRSDILNGISAVIHQADDPYRSSVRAAVIAASKPALRNSECIDELVECATVQ